MPPHDSSPAGCRRWLPIITVPTFVGLIEAVAGFTYETIWLHLLISFGAGLLVVAVSPKKSCFFAFALSLMSVSFVISGAFLDQMHQEEVRAHQAVGKDGHRATSARVEAMHSAGNAASGGLFSWMTGHSPATPAEVVPLETMSVVLPCAFEGGFAEQTVKAVVENTKKERLLEIVVVDDGSQPPLSRSFPTDLLKPKGLVNLVRHERTMGLISAKKTGGDAAKADIIVFLDCHVKPRPGWEEEMRTQMMRAGDHRTVVVPVISSLDPDTWQEIPNGPSSSACYILPNADFTWLGSSGRDVPLMSGGLLAISRKWWEETGGYDEHMVAWGGENIDQSLRTWLCGGRIEAARNAYVAHMWRDPKKPKTMLRYPIPTRDVMRNKARAVTAWFDGFKEKVFTYPEYEDFIRGSNNIGDMSNFDLLKSKLQCAPFSSYIDRFSYVYVDGGLIPDEVYQLREETTGLCLERVPQTRSPHHLALVPCASEHDGGGGPGSISELQLWHLGNKDTSKKGKCCSGIMQWNFLQCLDAQGMGSHINTYECNIVGNSLNQYIHLSDAGHFIYRNGDGAVKGNLRGNGGGCIAPETASLGKARYVGVKDCGTVVEPVASHSFFGSDTVKMGDGGEAPKSFRLRSTHGHGACAVGTGAASGEGAGWSLGFQPCDSKDPGQVFHVKPLLGGLQVQVGDTKMCLDAAGGGSILVYPCYEESAANMNQVWKVDNVNNHLIWKGQHEARGRCLDFQANDRPAASKGQIPLTLSTCTAGKGQQIQRVEHSAETGTFLLRHKETGKCVGIASSGNKVELGECEYGHRWKQEQGSSLLQLITGACIDAVDYKTPQIFSCHGTRTQWWAVDDENGWVKVKHAWEDNGRRRYFERCLDSEPAAPVEVSVQHCDHTKARGVKWTRHNVRTPLEATIWQKADKPKPGDPVLGGST